jgi:hypothetical protein
MSQTFGNNKAYTLAYKLTNNIMVKTEIPKDKKDVIKLSDY